MHSPEPSSASTVSGFPGGFCVLMAVYRGDDPALFERAILSVFANDLLPDQFVLVVDGPVPEAVAAIIAAHESAQRMEVVRLEQNVGLAQALNAGLACVRTTWVVRADADDFNLPSRFSRQAAAVRAEPALDVIGGAMLEVERDDTPIAVRATPTGHRDILRQMPMRNPMNHPAIAYRAELARGVGGYPSVHLKEDYAMWCMFAKANARFANLPDVLVRATAGVDMYRRRGGLRYIRSEIAMQRLMTDLGLKSRRAALLHGVMRSAVFAMPNQARALVYRRLLRKRA